MTTPQSIPTKCLRRELALVKVRAEGDVQNAALEIVGAWSGRLLELGQDHFTAEVSADPERVNGFIAALTPLGLTASFRSGVVSIS